MDLVRMLQGLVRCAELKERNESDALWDDESREALAAARALGWGNGQKGALPAMPIDRVVYEYGDLRRKIDKRQKAIAEALLSLVAIGDARLRNVNCSYVEPLESDESSWQISLHVRNSDTLALRPRYGTTNMDTAQARLELAERMALRWTIRLDDAVAELGGRPLPSSDKRSKLRALLLEQRLSERLLDEIMGIFGCS